MFSKSIFVKITSCLQVRNLSRQTSALSNKSAEKSELCYSIASPIDLCRILDYYEANFIRRDPLINALFPRGIPVILKNYYKEEVSTSPILVVAKNLCTQGIVGIAVNSVLKKNDERICKFFKQDRCDANLDKYFQTLTELYQSPKLNSKLCVDQILRVHAVTSAEDKKGQEIAKNLIAKSFEFGKKQKFVFSSIHCTSMAMKQLAEAMNCEKVWSKCYNDALIDGKYRPPSIPQPPNDSMNVYMKKLC